MRRILSLFLLSLMTLVLLGAVAMGILLARFNPNDYQQRLAQAVERATGRQLHFESGLSISFFPSISLNTGALALNEPDRFGPDPFLRVENARLQIAWEPLWEGVIQVDEVLLEGARLKLVTATGGLRNWEYGFDGKDAGNTLLYRHAEAPEQPLPVAAQDASALGASTSSPPEGGTPQTTPLRDVRPANTPDGDGVDAAARGTGLFGRNGFSLQVSRIVCPAAKVVYRDMRDGTSWSGTLDTASIGDARLDADMPFSLSGSVRDDTGTGKGTFNLQGMAHIGLEGNVSVRLTTVACTADGLADVPVRLRASALAAYEAGSRLVRLEQMEGELLMPAPEQGIRSGAAPADSADSADASLAVRTAFRGSTACSLPTPARPEPEWRMHHPLFPPASPLACRGELGLDTLDLDALLRRLHPPMPVVDPQAATQGAPNLTNPVVSKPKSGSRPPVLPPAGPGATQARQDSGKAAPEPGGSRAMRLPDLKLNLTLRMDSLRLRSLPLRDAEFYLDYKDRQAFIPYEAGLFDGRLNGTARLALHKGEPALNVSCVAKGVDLEQATRTLSGKYTITGRLQATLDLSGRGSTGTELLHSLSGTASAKVGKGEIRGFRLLPANLPAVKPLPADFPFTAMSFSAQIKEGLATSRDISLQSQVVTVRGGGTAHLAYSQLDLGLEFLPAGRPPAIPLGISGPYASLSYSVDMPTFLRNVGESAFDSPQGHGRLIREVGGMLFRQ